MLLKPVPVLILFCFLFVLNCSVYSSDKIAVTTFEYPGYMHEKTHPGLGKGFGVDVIIAAFKTSDIKPTIVFEPMKRSQFSFKNGRYDAMIGALDQFSKKEQEQIEGVVYGYGRFFLYYLKSKYKKVDFVSLFEGSSCYLIGSVRGSSSNPVLKQFGIEPDLAADMEQNFLKLIHGRIDLLSSIEQAAQCIIDEKFAPFENDIQRFEKPFLIIPLHVLFKKDKKTSILQHQFKEGLKQIQIDGTYLEIAQRYFGKNIPLESVLDACW